ncbi:MAG: peptidylprolyl isomerase [Nannocystaceae bacterium]
MRRLLPILLALSGLSLVGCTPAPKAEDGQKKEAKVKSEKKKKPKSGDLSDDTPLGRVPNGLVALVGGKPISRDAFMEVFGLKLKKYQERDRKIPRSADRRYRKSISERLIYQEVLRRESKEKKVEYDKEALKEKVEQQKKGVDDWPKRLLRRGENDDSLREQHVATLRERALLESSGALAVSDEDIAAEYERLKPTYKDEKPRVRASHVMISVGPKGREAAKAKADASEEEKKKWEEEAQKRADEVFAKATAADADFTALAKEFSDGPSANRGGDLGVFNKDRMVKEFSDVAFKLRAGKVSKPVRTKFGFHVIKVVEKYAPGVLPLDAVRDTIKTRLEGRKLHEGKRKLKEELLAKYEVENKMLEHLGPDPRKKRREKRRKEREKKAAEKKAAEEAGGEKSGGSTKSGADEGKTKKSGDGHSHGPGGGHDHDHGSKPAAKTAEAKARDTKKASPVPKEG